ncbi:MAG: hypothetical protein OEW48_02040 [Phycisphaerae bacterium]|nr:hypothetical protein [Phycisphaerae bacterium]
MRTGIKVMHHSRYIIFQRTVAGAVAALFIGVSSLGFGNSDPLHAPFGAAGPLTETSEGGQNKAERLPIVSVSTNVTQQELASQFLDWYRYSSEDQRYIKMDNATAYFRDKAVAGYTVLRASANGETWTADAVLPSGSTAHWPIVTFYFEYEGQTNCFEWVDHGIRKTSCGSTILYFTWYYDDDCLQTGDWTMTFYNDDVVYYSGQFTVLPEVDPQKAPPQFNQCQPPWDDLDYDTWCCDINYEGECIKNSQHTCDGRPNESQYVFCNKGCFLSALAMIMSYHGVSTDPGQLHNYLNSKSWGFGNGKANITLAMKYARDQGVNMEYRGESTTEGNEDLLRSYICKYGPQMIGTVGSRAIPNSHWVVAYGMTPDESTFLIRDPGWGYSTLEELVAAKGLCNGNSFCKIKIFWGPDFAAEGAELAEQTGTVEQASLFIQIPEEATAELLLTDPAGRRTGKDDASGQSYLEIPWSHYTQYGLDTHVIKGTDDMVKELFLRKPTVGVHILTIFGTGEGTVDVQIIGFDTDLTPRSTPIRNLPLSSGSINTFFINFDNAVGSPQILTADCPYGCGDLNGDGHVDLGDLSYLAQCYLSTPETMECFYSDLTQNGETNLRDFAELGSFYGLNAPLNELPGQTCSDGADNDCDGLIDCNDTDCLNDPGCWSCGNGRCDPDEDCEICSADCEGITTGPPSERFCCGNGILEDAEGDGTICDGNP